MSTDGSQKEKDWKKHYESKRHVALAGIVLAILVAIITIATGAKTLWFGSPTHTQSSSMTGNNGTQVNAGSIQSLTLNQGPKEKDSATPEGAREALGRMGLKFDNDGFSEAVRATDIETVKLYLVGGMSPNETYSSGGLFMLNLPILQNAPHFQELVDLFKAHGLAWKAVSPNPSFKWYLGNEPETQEDQVLLFAAGNNRTEQARILEKAGANPTVDIAAGKLQANYKYAKEDLDFLINLNQ